jgi:hypothetical protein
MLNPLRYVTAGWRWTRTMVAMLREARTHREQIHSTRDLLARELRENAYVTGQWHDQQWSIQNVRDAIKTQRWNQSATEWSVLRRKHSDLWNEVADVYEGLERTVNHGAAPPTAATLNDLATRLEGAEL